jgi:hypothetical protein
MRLVTFTTEESMEESKKSMDESKNGWSNNRRSKKQRRQEHRASNLVQLGLGEEEETAGIYIGGPLVPVGGSNWD